MMAIYWRLAAYGEYIYWRLVAHGEYIYWRLVAHGGYILEASGCRWWLYIGGWQLMVAIYRRLVAVDDGYILEAGSLW